MQMLFPDPRMRSPTTVPRPLLPWIKQIELEANADSFLDNCVVRINGVAMMSEAEPKDVMVVQIDGSRVELPLVYLSQLWPKPFRFDSPLRIERLQVLRLLSPVKGIVVLIGERPE